MFVHFVPSVNLFSPDINCRVKSFYAHFAAGYYFALSVFENNFKPEIFGDFNGASFFYLFAALDAYLLADNGAVIAVFF